MVKKIHQIWIGDPIPERYRIFSEEIKENHPDYEYIFWDDNLINDYFKNDCYYNTLRKHKNIPFAFITDYCRLQILKDSGGWYIDSDCEYISSLNNITTDKSILVGNMNNIINNAVIYSDSSIKAKEILSQMIKSVSINLESLDILFPPDKPHNYGYNHLNKFRWICTINMNHIEVLDNNYFYANMKENAIILHHKCYMSHSPRSHLRNKEKFGF